MVNLTRDERNTGKKQKNIIISTNKLKLNLKRRKCEIINEIIQYKI